MSPTASLHPGRWWHALDDSGRIQCDLCPRYCRPRPGQRGLCFVRQNVDGAMVLTTWGRSSGFCVDPIEKKPLNHFFPGTSVLSFGTAGCNLACSFCQNWDISKARDMDRLQSQATPEAIAARAVELGCRSVAFTYNDPVIFAEYALDVSAACRERGVKTVAVTAGYVTELARAEFFAGMDAANVDLKGFTERFYHQLCAGQLEPIKETLVYLARETDVWLEITTLLIPGENDSEDELTRLCGWVHDEVGPTVPVHFTAFRPEFRMIGLEEERSGAEPSSPRGVTKGGEAPLAKTTDKTRTPSQTLSRARRIAKQVGLSHVYTGNVHDADGGSTYCAGCGELLIERDWYELGAFRLTPEGACPDCGETLAGHFEAEAGSWGRKRLPVRF